MDPGLAQDDHGKKWEALSGKHAPLEREQGMLDGRCSFSRHMWFIWEIIEFEAVLLPLTWPMVEDSRLLVRLIHPMIVINVDDDDDPSDDIPMALCRNFAHGINGLDEDDVMHLEKLWCTTDATFYKMIEGHTKSRIDVTTRLKTLAENNDATHRFKRSCWTFWDTFASTMTKVDGHKVVKAWGELERWPLCRRGFSNHIVHEKPIHHLVP